MDDDRGATLPDPSDPDVADLARLAKSLRAEDTERVAVPAELWNRIETELSGELEPTPAPESDPSLGGLRPIARPITTAPGHRRRRLLAVAGLVGVAASMVAAVWIVAQGGDDAQIVASTPLSNDGLATFPVVPHGSARLIDDHGRRYLEVQVQDAPAVNGDYVELWLIDRQVQGMVSLGPYHGDDRYEVPAGVDAATFPIVDVSLEPGDGVPTHSGVSIVRGVLDVSSAVESGD